MFTHTLGLYKALDQARKELAERCEELEETVASRDSQIEDLKGELDRLSKLRRAESLTRIGEEASASKKQVEEQARAFEDLNRQIKSLQDDAVAGKNREEALSMSISMVTAESERRQARVNSLTKDVERLTTEVERLTSHASLLSALSPTVSREDGVSSPTPWSGGSPALGASDDDLAFTRRKYQQLKTQVRDLEAELEAAQASDTQARADLAKAMAALKREVGEKAVKRALAGSEAGWQGRADEIKRLKDALSVARAGGGGGIGGGLAQGPGGLGGSMMNSSALDATMDGGRSLTSAERQRMHLEKLERDRQRDTKRLELLLEESRAEVAPLQLKIKGLQSRIGILSRQTREFKLMVDMQIDPNMATMLPLLHEIEVLLKQRSAKLSMAKDVEPRVRRVVNFFDAHLAPYFAALAKMRRDMSEEDPEGGADEFLFGELQGSGPAAGSAALLKRAANVASAPGSASLSTSPVRFTTHSVSTSPEAAARTARDLALSGGVVDGPLARLSASLPELHECDGAVEVEPVAFDEGDPDFDRPELYTTRSAGHLVAILLARDQRIHKLKAAVRKLKKQLIAEVPFERDDAGTAGATSGGAASSSSSAAASAAFAAGADDQQAPFGQVSPPSSSAGIPPPTGLSIIRVTNDLYQVSWTDERGPSETSSAPHRFALALMIPGTGDWFKIPSEVPRHAFGLSWLTGAGRSGTYLFRVKSLSADGMASSGWSEPAGLSLDVDEIARAEGRQPSPPRPMPPLAMPSPQTPRNTNAPTITTPLSARGIPSGRVKAHDGSGGGSPAPHKLMSTAQRAAAAATLRASTAGGPVGSPHLRHGSPPRHPTTGGPSLMGPPGFMNPTASSRAKSPPRREGSPQRR